MFKQIRFQTGELDDVVKEMKSGNIPCMDVDTDDEFKWVLAQLAQRGILLAEDIPLDRNARDRIKEDEFEYRAAFRTSESGEKLMYIDFYSEPIQEETYDSIFGD